MTYYTDTTGNPSPPLQQPTPVTTRGGALFDKYAEQRVAAQPANLNGPPWLIALLSLLIIALCLGGLYLSIAPVLPAG
jgi:hypothetical protein